MPENNYCGGAAGRCSAGEVRILPLPGGANLIVCRACHKREMEERIIRNRRDLAPSNRYPVPAFGDLTIYNVEG